MPDNDNSNQNQDDPKDLRTKLEAALKREKDKDKLISNLQGTVLMPNLTERQRRIVLRELSEENKEATADSVKEVATDLGFKMEGTTTSQNSNQDGQTQGQTQGEGQTDDQNKSGGTDGTQDPAGSQTELPPEVLVALEAMGRMDLVSQYSDRGPDHDVDFETKMNEAKTPEELTAIIRQDGARHGLVHSWDVE
jgi:hypothetical protein